MSINIAEAKSFIEANLDQVRKSQHVASHLNCSLEGLKRSFHRAENLSISKYIRASRIARMKEELKNSDTACKVICLELGLREDVGARLFKHATGMTMEGFRRLSRLGLSCQDAFPQAKSELAQGGKRLILTETAIRQVLSNGASNVRTSTVRRSDIVTQGPAN